MSQEIANKFTILLDTMVQSKASDLYLRSDHVPYLRIEGNIIPIDIPPITAAEMDDLAKVLLRPDQQEAFDKKPEMNVMYASPRLGRFRLNIFMQRNAVAMVIRKIREDIEDVTSLGLPKVLESVCMKRSGLILVTGPTGSGKSTTLASLIKYRNKNSNAHIITIEDPIEFIHEDINCIVTQREVGIDTLSFKDALESAVRQAPDVLLIGEMRDVESVKAGLYFSETGHLVFGTLHANNSTQTIERLLQFFPMAVHPQILQELSINLRAVFSQRLLKHKDTGKRIPAYEMMLVNSRFKELLAKADLSTIARELDKFHPDGMISFDTCLIAMLKAGKINMEAALSATDNPNDLKLKIKTLGLKFQ